MNQLKFMTKIPFQNNENLIFLHAEGVKSKNKPVKSMARNTVLWIKPEEMNGQDITNKS